MVFMYCYFPLFLLRAHVQGVICMCHCCRRRHENRQTLRSRHLCMLQAQRIGRYVKNWFLYASNY